ncbi:Endonuclease-reverse transcriptase [Operophtera brumata]|uniref:Endonuclease-reverse transcriptase n=1 Tax=Operophtera brumata TaxID=104452 RepID=A0A0L7LQH2_OPEBR|nr:Endonuclease-reverse transcriptase [Operophtera brumata]
MPVDVVDNYIYLGHKITLGIENQTAEVERRISQAWAAFGANKRIMRGKLHLKINAKVFEQCIMPVFTYGTETMSLTK